MPRRDRGFRVYQGRRVPCLGMVGAKGAKGGREAGKMQRFGRRFGLRDDFGDAITAIAAIAAIMAW